MSVPLTYFLKSSSCPRAQRRGRIPVFRLCSLSHAAGYIDFDSALTSLILPAADPRPENKQLNLAPTCPMSYLQLGTIKLEIKHRAACGESCGGPSLLTVHNEPQTRHERTTKTPCPRFPLRERSLPTPQPLLNRTKQVF